MHALCEAIGYVLGIQTEIRKYIPAPKELTV